MTNLKGRFDKAGVVEALLRLRLVRNDRDMAQKFAGAGRVVECAPGEVLIEQGGWDNDLYFIPAAEFHAFVNGQNKQTRVVGEIAASRD